MEKHYLHIKYFFNFMCTFYITNYSCEDRIEQSVPRDHCLSHFGKSRDAKRRSLGRIVLSYHHTHDCIIATHIHVSHDLP